MVRWAFLAVLLAVVAAIAIGAALMLQPHGPAEPALVEFEPGQSVRDLAAELERRDVVASRWLFLAVRAARPKTILMAGEYEFEEARSPWQVFEQIARGRVYLRPLTVPEGLTRFEVAELVADAGYGSREELLEITADPTLVKDLLPDAETLEGCLFPETYRFPKTATGAQVVGAMVSHFRRAFEQTLRDRHSPLEPYQLLTLASLIEKETGVDRERPLVSSVFHNRLERGMRLQCDPTIIYGLLLEDRYRGSIFASDLQDPHPYNTYLIEGLPPGPIANPGLASLEAAARPTESDYLFFVAESGDSAGHVFSSSLAAHNQAVNAYRRSLQRP